MRRLVLMTLTIISISSCGGKVYKQHIDQAINFCSDKGGLSHITRANIIAFDFCQAFCADEGFTNLSGDCS